MEKRIAFFDFDGTITYKDTLLEFIRHCKGAPAFYFGFLLKSPWLVAYKLKLISNQTAKEKILQHFFKGMDKDEFDKHCREFVKEKLPALIRPKALHELAILQKENIDLVIVSASPENWIKGWSDTMNAQLIATKLDEQNDKLTGKIKGKNCHGNEKVHRIRTQFQLEEYSVIYAYGDTKGDEPMLSLANFRFMKPFR